MVNFEVLVPLDRANGVCRSAAEGASSQDIASGDMSTSESHSHAAAGGLLNRVKDVNAGDELVVASFYKFAELKEYENMRQPIKELCEENVDFGVKF